MEILARLAYLVSMVFLSRRARREAAENKYTFGEHLGGTLVVILGLIAIGLFWPIILPAGAVFFIFYLIGRKS